MFSSNLSAQFGSRGKEFNYVDAENFYKARNYYDALPLYQLLLEKHPRIIEYRLKIGICHLNLSDSTEKAIEYLAEVYKRKPKEPNVLYYLGKAYAINYMHEMALEKFNEALSSKYVSVKFKEEIPHLIQQCNNAIVLMKDSLPVSIVNIGEPINSVNNEYSPTVSADETTIIFTYKGIKSTGQRQDEFNRPEVNGNFYEDIHFSKLVDGKWTEPESMGDSINTDFHEASISLSPDGQKLFFYKDDPLFSGDILEVDKVEGKWGVPKSLAINTKGWEGHAAVSPNGKFMIFSSERTGGEGGRDLYSAVLQEDGTWGNIKNLGATINTKYNDDAPFIHSDGVTFNFSSEGHNSMGGYDIFESKIITDSSYLAPRNMGYPINTAANDIFFYVSGKGNAYYSSAKKGGYGQQDIYVINVRDIITSKAVLLVKGVVTKNGSFDNAKITVRTQGGQDLGVYYSDLTDGKYQIYADLNEIYEITFITAGFDAQKVIIDATKFEEYTEVVKDVNFSKDEVVVEGTALLKENPFMPLKNVRVILTNHDKTINRVDTTDENGRFRFDHLPGDQKFIIFINAEDEKGILEPIYYFKGKVTLDKLPYTRTSINELDLADDGSFMIEMANNSESKLRTADLSTQEVLSKYGDVTHPDLVFKIQVGAYSVPANFSSQHLKGLGKITSAVLDDGITRFTMGEYETLRAAKTALEKVKATGQEDAFILLFLAGKRTYLEDLIETGIFK